MAELYDATSAMVYSLAERLLRNPLQAEEAVLDVFRYAWDRAKQFDPGRGSVQSWLLTITRGRSIDRLRASTARRQREEPLPDWTSSTASRGQAREGRNSTSEALELSAAKNDPMEDMLHTEQQNSLQRALAALPAKTSHLIEQAFLYGKTHQLISEETGEPLGTIKSQIRRGLLRLHELLLSVEPRRYPS